LSSEQLCEPKSLDTAGVERSNTLEKLAVAVNTGGHLIRVSFNVRSVSDGEYLCSVVGDSQKILI